MKKQLRPYKALTLAVALVLSLSTLSVAQNAAPMNLNGQSFKLELVDGQNNVTHDVINFKETSFTCNAIDNTTFTATRYTVQQQDDGRLFLYAIAISETEGNITWKGYVKDGALEGGMLIEKTGFPVEKHLFTGTSRVNTNPSK